MTGSRPVRLIASDMDGTLLRSDLTISSRARAAVAAATSAGIRVVAATGRGWRSATPLLGVVPEIVHAVCSNGALIRDVAGGITTDTHPLGRSTLARLLDVLIDTVPSAGLAWEMADGSFGYDAIYRALRDPEMVPPDADAAPPVSDDVLKILVRDPDLDEGQLLERLVPVIPEGALATFSGIETVEITGAGVHKAAALAVLCARLGIEADEVVAMGDNRNDVEMLRWAGTGVAMGNAHPEAVAAADEQTTHHMDDGAALVIERALP